MVLDRSSHDLTSLTKADIYQVSGQPLPGLGHYTLVLTNHEPSRTPAIVHTHAESTQTKVP